MEATNRKTLLSVDCFNTSESEKTAAFIIGSSIFSSFAFEGRGYSRRSPLIFAQTRNYCRRKELQAFCSVMEKVRVKGKQSME